MAVSKDSTYFPSDIFSQPGITVYNNAVLTFMVALAKDYSGSPDFVAERASILADAYLKKINQPKYVEPK